MFAQSRYSHFLFGIIFSTNVLAHGYVHQPEARGYKCKLGSNSNCGAIQWEPQSLEGKDGFPEMGPADGRIASAGLIQFSALDEQTASRWQKNKLTPGANQFSWTFTANHVTRNWRYYITKVGWNSSQSLQRSSFDLKPFCQIDGNMQRPPSPTVHNCHVPQRQGYHVILAVWEVGDTVNSFYNVIDVLFGSAEPEPPVSWLKAGTIYPSVNLRQGDKVRARVFDTDGERQALGVSIVIESDAMGHKNQWSHALATAINQQREYVKAGNRNSDGSFTAVFGQNPIYVQTSSSLNRVEVEIKKSDIPPTHGWAVSGVEQEYFLKGSNQEMTFEVAVTGKWQIEARLFDSAGKTKGFTQKDIADSREALSIQGQELMPGLHQLVVKARNETTEIVQQKTFDIQLKKASSERTYDYTFPQSLSAYKAGTKVMQPKDGKVYQCKAFPFSGFCRQWSASSNQYEPGVGSHWQQAWELVN